MNNSKFISSVKNLTGGMHRDFIFFLALFLYISRVK